MNLTIKFIGFLDKMTTIEYKNLPLIFREYIITKVPHNYVYLYMGKIITLLTFFKLTKGYT